MELTTFLEPYSPEMRELTLQTRELVRATLPNLTEQLDPYAHLIAFGTSPAYAGLVCGIITHARHVNLMFARGATLPDPDGLLEGSGKKARHIKIAFAADLSRPGVTALLLAAMKQHAG